MKKSIILIFCFMLVLSSCAKKESVPVSETQTTTPVATATATPVASPNATTATPSPDTKKSTEQATASGKPTTTNTPKPTAQSTVAPTLQATTAPKSDVKTFNSAELAKYNGQNGTPAYIAVNGNVYDVTSSSKWKGGSHKGYPAGVDYTTEFAKQHDLSMLDGFEIVGKYTK